MARLGPWDAARRVAIAVSGGPDSLALALLAKRWGDPAGLVVDHGLRPGSATEALAAQATLAALGIPSTVLTLDSLRPGPALAARARAARYLALSAACRSAGLVDLLLGHHAGDQAETVLMRRRRSSGPAGLAGMAALAERDDVRLLRPLLAMLPSQLRALVDAAGLAPALDPGNDDLRNTRARLRHEIGTDRAGLLAAAADAGRSRAEADGAVAREMAERACLFPEAYATVSPGPLRPDTLSALLRSLSGRRYPVAAPRLAAALSPATRAGIQVRPAGSGWLLAREEAAVAGPCPATPGTVWDNRFRVGRCPPGLQVAPLGPAHLRPEPSLPGIVTRTLPALLHDGVLSAVPHLRCGSAGGVGGEVVLHRACQPASGAPFLPS